MTNKYLIQLNYHLTADAAGPCKSKWNLKNADVVIRVLIDNLTASSPLQIFTVIVKQRGGNILGSYSTWSSQGSEHEAFFCAWIGNVPPPGKQHTGSLSRMEIAAWSSGLVDAHQQWYLAEGGAIAFISLLATRTRVQRLPCTKPSMWPQSPAEQDTPQRVQRLSMLVQILHSSI